MDTARVPDFRILNNIFVHFSLQPTSSVPGFDVEFIVGGFDAMEHCNSFLSFDFKLLVKAINVSPKHVYILEIHSTGTPVCALSSRHSCTEQAKHSDVFQLLTNENFSR